MSQYKNFFAQQRILIVDDHSSTRVAVARCFSELGVTAAQMSLANSLHAARELVAQNNFTMIVCEYELDFESGIDLIASVPGLELSVVISRNQSEHAVAEAAENNIDIFLKKPFSINELKDALARAISAKQAEASDVELQDLEEAIDTIAYVSTAKQVYDRAGYRALSELCDSLLAEGKKTEAYVALKRLVKNHPLHPDRLAQAMRLSVETRSFNDVADYYSLFLKVDSKSDELVRHAYAALIMAGKAHLEMGDRAQAMDEFKKAMLTSGKRASVIKEIVLTLVDKGQVEDAESFIRAYPQHERDSIEFLSLDYVVMARSQPLHLILQRGHELVREGNADPAIYEVLIQACQRAGHAAEAESLVLTAARLWPTRSADYEALIAAPSLQV